MKPKRVTDTALLEGHEETMTVMDFRKAPGDALLKVQMGMVITLTSYGKPVAVLMRPAPTALQLGAEIRRLGLAGK